MKVLMIGTATANDSNYGMGVASAHIAQSLAPNCELTVISPTQASEIKSGSNKHLIQVKVTEALTDQKQVDAAAVHIAIESNLQTYIYDQQTAETSSEKPVKTNYESIQTQLNTFSDHVIEEASALNYDVIYAHDWLSIEAAIGLKNRFKKPFFLHIHSLDYDRTGKNSRSWVYDLEKRGMEEAEKVIAVSNYHAKIMQEHYGIAKAKIKVVSLALAKVKDIPYSSPFAEKIVLFSGRLSHQKGVFKFIDIAEALIETESDLRFIVAGAGELSQEVVSRVQEKNLTAYFNFTGRLSQEELNALMKHCEIFIMPSVSEPFGLVAIEAAAKALPIVMTKNAGAGDLLKSAFIPKEESVEAYVKQIKMVLTNKVKVAESVKLNQLAANSRNWQQVGAEILHILNN